MKKKYTAGDVLTLPLDLINNGLISPIYAGPKLEILFEDELVLALNKPNNLHCHPLGYQEHDNCLSFLRSSNPSKYYEALLVNSTSYDRGLLYRLDFATSGVLFYIKNQKLFNSLRTNFFALVKNKIYLAIVEGDFLQEGAHQHYLTPTGPKGAKMKVSSAPSTSSSSFFANLEVKKLKFGQEQNLSLLKIKLHTGIRHQIRAQLMHLGHPILGDTLYGGATSNIMYLHAYSYKIVSGDLEYQIVAPNNLFNLFCDVDRCL